MAIARGVQVAKPAADALIAAVISHVSSAPSLQAAADSLEAIPWPEEGDYVQAIFEETYRCNLLGRLQVEQEAGSKIELAQTRWIDLPFLEAIEAFKVRKEILSKDSHRVLSDALKQKAWTIAGDHTEYTREITKESLQTAIEEGWSKGEWMKWAKAEGIPSLGDWHLETVFDTNVLSSYQHGRWKQQSSASMKFRRPILVYRTVGDPRVRESHAAMDGFAAHRDHPVWGEWYPPNGYRCRCRIEAKHPEDVGELFPLDEDPGVKPDEGWATNPGQWLKEPGKSQRD